MTTRTATLLVLLAVGLAQAPGSPAAGPPARAAPPPRTAAPSGSTARLLAELRPSLAPRGLQLPFATADGRAGWTRSQDIGFTIALPPGWTQTEPAREDGYTWVNCSPPDASWSVQPSRYDAEEAFELRAYLTDAYDLAVRGVKGGTSLGVQPVGIGGLIGFVVIREIDPQHPEQGRLVEFIGFHSAEPQSSRRLVLVNFEIPAGRYEQVAPTIASILLSVQA